MTISPDFLADAANARAGDQRTRARRSLLVSVLVLTIWLIFVSTNGHWGRVGDRWWAALTMIFGGIVAGATPQGGGAVAFPVFTKIVEVPATVARSFSLFIQTIGMGAASLSILITNRRVDWRSLSRIAPAAVAGFLAAAWLIGDSDTPYWPSTLPPAYVKVTFTIVVAVMAALVWLGDRDWFAVHVDTVGRTSRRADGLLLASGAAGGVASFLVGSGADVFAYLGLVALLGLAGRVGVPTSVVAMAVVSIVGFMLFGIVDGQLSIALNDAGDVVTVGGVEMATPVQGDRYDLFGLWLAAVPVVGFGAPLGSWLASKASDKTLVRVVVGLALAEILTTAVFLDELRTNPSLVIFALSGLVVGLLGSALVFRNRHWLLGIPAATVEATIRPTRNRLDRDRLAEQRSGGDSDEAHR
ncbi:MAG: TSUP family transporter [Acidimicrobiales bacterium]